MASKIEFDGTGDGVNDSGIHFISPILDYTYCGLTLDGDNKTTGGFEYSKKKVNCKTCIELIEYAKSIKKTEYIKNA